MPSRRRISPVVFACLALARLDAATPPLTVLHVDPDLRFIQRAGPHEVDSVDRDRHLRTYHVPGMFDDARNAELKALNLAPARGTGPYFSDPAGDASRQAWDARIDVQIANYVALYRRARELHPGSLHAMAGGSYPTHPPKDAAQADAAEVDSTMQVSKTRAVAPEQHDMAAGLVSRWLSAIKQGGGSPPRYFSPLNEPDASWRGTANPPRDHALFARAVAQRLATEHPDIKVSGPCSAWPYPGADFARWVHEGWERTFIDEVGDLAGAYDLHFYSKELWAYGPESPAYDAARHQPDANLFASLSRGHTNTWEFGQMDALLDLVYAYHQSRWKTPGLPILVSEFGRQGITPQKGPWPNDYLYYLYSTTVTRLAMRLMDRPEVALAVPFVLPESDRGYAPERGQSLYTRPRASSGDFSLEPTPLLGLYAFLRNFQGERVAADWTGLPDEVAPGVYAIAARDRSTLRILLHNAPPTPLAFRLELPPDVRAPVAIARSRWEADRPTDFRAAFRGGWRADPRAEEKADPASIVLAGEETALLEIALPSSPAGSMPRRRIVERRYANLTLAALHSGEQCNATVALPEGIAHARQAELVLDLAFPRGPEQPVDLEIVLNGEPLPPFRMPAFLRGWREVMHPLRVDLPVSRLRAGSNRITLRTKSDDVPAGARLIALRVDVCSESPESSPAAAP